MRNMEAPNFEFPIGFEMGCFQQPRWASFFGVREIWKPQSLHVRFRFAFTKLQPLRWSGFQGFSEIRRLQFGSVGLKVQQCRFRRCLISLEAGCYCTQEIWRPHLLSFRVGPTGLKENLSTASMLYKRAKCLGPICANSNDVSKMLKHGPNCPHGCRGVFLVHPCVVGQRI